MNIQEEIERAKEEKSQAKREGRSTTHADNRLKNLYSIPQKKAKRAKISIL